MRAAWRAADDAVRPLAHQQVVAGDPRLALGAVDDQRFDAPGGARLELEVAGEGGAAQADDARIAQQVAQGLRRTGRRNPVGARSIQRSSPSGSITTQSAGRPEGCGSVRDSSASTLPEVGAWMADEKSPSGAPMRSPLSTLRPAFTSGRGVPPALWRSGTTSCGGSGARAIGVRVDRPCAKPA
jgi:hypothetical protein